MMKNKQDLIAEKEQLYTIKKQSLLLSSIFKNDFLLRLGGKKALEAWRDTMLDDMNKLKKDIKDLLND